MTGNLTNDSLAAGIDLDDIQPWHRIQRRLRLCIIQGPVPVREEFKHDIPSLPLIVPVRQVKISVLPVKYTFATLNFHKSISG
jgi:hypothetical protein